MPVPENHKLEQLVDRLFETRNRFLMQACSDSPLSCLSPKEIRILEIVAAETGQTMGKLALRSSLAMSTLRGIVARLETLDLVERRHSSSDRRIIEVHLKSTGLKACAERGNVKNELCSHILSPLSNEERKEFLRMLEIIVSNSTQND